MFYHNFIFIDKWDPSMHLGLYESTAVRYVLHFSSIPIYFLKVILDLLLFITVILLRLYRILYKLIINQVIFDN